MTLHQWDKKLKKKRRMGVTWSVLFLWRNSCHWAHGFSTNIWIYRKINSFLREDYHNLLCFHKNFMAWKFAYCKFSGQQETPLSVPMYCVVEVKLLRWSDICWIGLPMIVNTKNIKKDMWSHSAKSIFSNSWYDKNGEDYKALSFCFYAV